MARRFGGSRDFHPPQIRRLSQIERRMRPEARQEEIAQRVVVARHEHVSRLRQLQQLAAKVPANAFRRAGRPDSRLAQLRHRPPRDFE